MFFYKCLIFKVFPNVNVVYSRVIHHKYTLKINEFWSFSAFGLIGLTGQYVLKVCKSSTLFMISLKYFHGQNWNIDIIKVRKLFALKRTCWGQNRLKHTQSIVREKGEERRENSFVAVFWYSNHAVRASTLFITVPWWTIYPNDPIQFYCIFHLVWIPMTITLIKFSKIVSYQVNLTSQHSHL